MKEWKPRIISFLPALLEIDGIELARGRVVHRNKNSQALTPSNLESPSRLAFHHTHHSHHHNGTPTLHSSSAKSIAMHYSTHRGPPSREGRWGMSNARSVRSSSPQLFPNGNNMRSRSASPHSSGRLTAKEQRVRDEQRSSEYNRKQISIERQRAEQEVRTGLAVFLLVMIIVVVVTMMIVLTQASLLPLSFIYSTLSHSLFNLTTPTTHYTLHIIIGAVPPACKSRQGGQYA